MIALALSTVFSAGFALLIRVAQGMGANLIAVGAANYLTAALVNTALFLIGGPRIPHGSTIALALVGGLTYASAFFLVYLLTRRRGASITAAVMRLSTLVPVAVSLAAWGERLSPVQGAGAAVAFASLPLLTLRPPRRPAPTASGPKDARGRRDILLLLGLFAINGLCLLAPRTFRQTDVPGEEAVFLAMLFSVACLEMCVVWAVSERRAAPAPRHALLLDLAPGVAIGACNALQNRFLVAALQQLPATVVFPFSAAAGLVLTVAVARLAWRERFGPAAAVGLLLACVSILLVNLG